jgi:hypothetical protein
LLLISDVLGEVGQRPQGLPKSDRPAGEKRGQGSPDEEDREPLPEGGSPIMAKITPMTTKMTPKIPMNISTVDHSLSAP